MVTVQQHYSSRVSGIRATELNNTREIILIGRYVTERIEVWRLDTVRILNDRLEANEKCYFSSLKELVHKDTYNYH